jgi:tetratricopeptide (TPR) repeat protein
LLFDQRRKFTPPTFFRSPQALPGAARHPRAGRDDARLGLARSLRGKGDFDLADRAYRAAFDAEPTNAQILWDRAQTLRQAGRTTEAQKLFLQLAQGDWPPSFTWLQSQARLLTGER